MQDSYYVVDGVLLETVKYNSNEKQYLSSSEIRITNPPTVISQVADEYYVISEKKKVTNEVAEGITLDDADESLDSFAEVVSAFKCHECPFLTRDRPSLLCHYQLSHNVGNMITGHNVSRNKSNSLRSLLVQDTLEKNVLVCDPVECLGNDESERKSEKVNSNRQHVKVLLLCGNCNKPLDSQEAAKEHMLNEHNAQVNQQSSSNNSEKNDMTIMKVTKVHSSKRKRRAKHHVKAEKVQCDVCKEMFANKQVMRRHIRAVHSRIKPFVCHVCGHSTTHKNHLLLHARQHTGERPFACKFCDYRASDHNTLRRHTMRHLGIKPYKSPVCDYASVQKHQLRRHMHIFHPDIALPFTKTRKTPCKPESRGDPPERECRSRTADTDSKSNLRQCMRDIFLHEEISEEPLDHGGVTIPAT